MLPELAFLDVGPGKSGPRQLDRNRPFLTFAGHSGIALSDPEAFTRHTDVSATGGPEIITLARLPHSRIARGTAKWRFG